MMYLMKMQNIKQQVLRYKAKVQTMIMMHEGCKINEKMKLKPKTKKNATKNKVNMIC